MSMFSRLFGGGGRSVAPLPYPPMSPEGLAARWVRWVAGIGPVRNPVGDDSGLYADINQPDDVWFLAGTFGDNAERSCPVPAGRPLFFPAFNMWHWPAQGPPSSMPHAFGTLLVDGRPYELDVIATPIPFEVAGAALNPVTRTKARIPTTVWGIWRKLDPLPPGPHVVQFSGGDGHGFTVNVTYHLMVA
ncbi:hypothetical protein [Actinoplanes friuliensis]|jgi:hypothetical protein|uniref:Uncharacterized protein n=1 Tax=Actinoplanes friuliensis DSM 7358 TaxID=1246995 RepID=U5W978_9ACTN|nr:hypothetical protein [Actinoplanes friuliensis]AGZ45758.1 hypothetical protein AFR_37520 [Actinoplanes friuliensis DSM 7358]